MHNGTSQGGKNDVIAWRGLTCAERFVELRNNAVDRHHLRGIFPRVTRIMGLRHFRCREVMHNTNVMLMRC